MVQHWLSPSRVVSGTATIAPNNAAVGRRSILGLGETMRHARRRTLLVPAVALVVLAVPLAGCGSSGSPGPAASSSPAAAGGTASAAAAAASFVSIVEP